MDSYRVLFSRPADLVLEAAVAFGAEAILTHNTKDFSGCEKFGIKVLTPAEYLKEKGKR